MTLRTVFILAVLAIASVAAAIYGVTQRVNFQATNFEGQRIFPDLLESASEVRTMRVIQGGVTHTFALEGDQWTLVESDGYPVNNNTVTKVLFSLANMEYLERRTALPARHARLNLGVPEEEGTNSQRVTLLSGDGTVMADLVVGQANFFLPETTTGGMYVRMPGEDQTWLARGLVDIGTEPRDWLQREIVDLQPEQIVRVDVRQPDGTEFVVVPDENARGGFSFANLPADRRLTSEFAPRNVAALLLNFITNDVRKSSSVELDPASAYVGTYQADNDMTVTLRMWQQDEQQYLDIEAAYTGDDTTSDAAKMVDAINARSEGWIYIVPEYQFEQISKSWDAVSEKVEPAS